MANSTAARRAESLQIGGDPAPDARRWILTTTSSPLCSVA
jgi:hypothetical protein